MKASLATALSRLLLIAGAFLAATAIVWWWLSYREVYQNNYLSLIDAGACLVQDSTICKLAASLCRSQHPLAFLAYSPNVLWIGAAALCASLVARGARREGAR